MNSFISTKQPKKEKKIAQKQQYSFNSRRPAAERPKKNVN